MASCHSMRFDIADGARDKTIEDRNYFYLFALVPTRNIDVGEKCSAGVAAVYEETTFVDGLINLLTIGIVAPRSVTYYCLSEEKATGTQP